MAFDTWFGFETDIAFPPLEQLHAGQLSNLVKIKLSEFNTLKGSGGSQVFVPATVAAPATQTGGQPQQSQSSSLGSPELPAGNAGSGQEQGALERMEARGQTRASILSQMTMKAQL